MHSHNLAHEVEAMVLQEFTGLCTTCDHVTTCGFPDARKGVVQCESFENESGVSPGVTNMFIAPDQQVFFSEAKGICANCSRFQECRLPKDQAGVWHCEEYE